MPHARRALSALAAAALAAVLVVPTASATEPQGASAPAAAVPVANFPSAAKAWVGRSMSALSSDCTYESTEVTTGGGAVDVLRVCLVPSGDSWKWSARLATQLPGASRPTNVRTLTGPAGAEVPHLATAKNGSAALVVPTASSTQVWRRAAKSTSWSKTDTLKGAPTSVAVGLSRQGTLTVATAVGRSLTVRTAAAGAKLSAPQTVATASPKGSVGREYEYTSLALSVDGSGAAVLAYAFHYVDWDWKERTTKAVVATRKAGASRFGTPTTFTTSALQQVSVVQAGAKSVVAWAGATGARARVKPSATGQWTSATTLSKTYSTVTLAGSGNGRVDVATTTFGGSLTTRSLGKGTASKFSAVRFTASRVVASEVRIVHRGAGEPVLVYSVTSDRSNPTATQRQAVAGTSGTGWSSFTILASSSVAIPGAAAAGDGEGNAAIHMRPASQPSYLAVWR